MAKETLKKKGKKAGKLSNSKAIIRAYLYMKNAGQGILYTFYFLNFKKRIIQRFM